MLCKQDASHFVKWFLNSPDRPMLHSVVVLENGRIGTRNAQSLTKRALLWCQRPQILPLSDLTPLSGQIGLLFEIQCLAHSKHRPYEVFKIDTYLKGWVMLSHVQSPLSHWALVKLHMRTQHRFPSTQYPPSTHADLVERFCKTAFPQETAVWRARGHVKKPQW